MRPIRFTTDPAALVVAASAAMLARQPVAVALPADWERPECWPLPITRKREKPRPSGRGGCQNLLALEQRAERAASRAVLAFLATTAAALICALAII